MSSYQNETISMEAVAGTNLCSHLGANVVDMALVAQSRDALAAATNAFAAESVATSLDAPVLETLQTVAPVSWPALEAALGTGADAAAAARAAFAEADQAYGRAVRDVLLETIQSFTAQESQGFASVTTELGEHVAAVYAVRAEGDERVMYVVDDAGQLRQEYAGHAGTSCDQRAAELAAYAQERGVVLSTTEHVPVRDDRDDGVRLIGAATASDRTNPAAGLVRSLEARRGVFDVEEQPVRRAASAPVGGAR